MNITKPKKFDPTISGYLKTLYTFVKPKQGYINKRNSTISLTALNLLIKCATYYFKPKIPWYIEISNVIVSRKYNFFIEIMYWFKKVNYSFSNDMKIENIYSFIVRTIDQYKRTRQKNTKNKRKIRWLKQID